MVEQKVLTSCRRTVEKYQPILASAETFPGLIELAYWSAQNVLDVHSCLSMPHELKEGDTKRFDEIVQRYSQAELSHHRRKFAYWKSMNHFHDETDQYAESIRAKDSDRTRIHEFKQASYEKLFRLQFCFPGISQGFDPAPIGNLEEFSELLNGNERFGANRRVCEVAYFNMRNTLDVAGCLETIGKKLPLTEIAKQYQQTRQSHNDRATAYWEAMFEFGQENYELARKARVPSDLLDKLWAHWNSSHMKLVAIDCRHNGLSKDKILWDRKQINREIDERPIKRKRVKIN